MTWVTPKEIQLCEVSAAKLVWYLRHFHGAPGCWRTWQVMAALPIPEVLLTMG